MALVVVQLVDTNKDKDCGSVRRFSVTFGDKALLSCGSTMVPDIALNRNLVDLDTVKVRTKNDFTRQASFFLWGSHSLQNQLCVMRRWWACCDCAS